MKSLKKEAFKSKWGLKHRFTFLFIIDNDIAWSLTQFVQDDLNGRSQTQLCCPLKVTPMSTSYLHDGFTLHLQILLYSSICFTRNHLIHCWAILPRNANSSAYPQHHTRFVLQSSREKKTTAEVRVCTCEHAWFTHACPYRTEWTLHFCCSGPFCWRFLILIYSIIFDIQNTCSSLVWISG